MNWINVSSVEELKKVGENFKVVKKVIKDDIEKIYKTKKSKDKNIIKLTTINSTSWKGLYDKIKAFREVTNYIDTMYIDKSKVQNKSDNDSNLNMYFKNKGAEYIYYLLELDGKQRAQKLNITMKCYSDKLTAKRWRDSIARVIHPDKCKEAKANEAICKLNQLYEEMVGVEK